MKHEYYEILISRDKDNDLNSEEKNILDKHMLNCDKCRELQSQFNSLSLILRGEKLAVSKKKPTIYKINSYMLSSAAAVLLAFGLIFFLNKESTTEDIKLASTDIVTEVALETETEAGILDSYYSYTTPDETIVVDEEADYNVLSSYYSYFE